MKAKVRHYAISKLKDGGYRVYVVFESGRQRVLGTARSLAEVDALVDAYQE